MKKASLLVILLPLVVATRNCASVGSISASGFYNWGIEAKKSFMKTQVRNLPHFWQ